MASRLLDRQVRLLDYLSSAAALFGDQADAPVDPALQGIDRGLLRLEARFACNRRLEKIVAAFPRTFEISGAEQSLILHEFVEVSRPTAASTLANARQFYEFLSPVGGASHPNRPICRMSPPASLRWSKSAIWSNIASNHRIRARAMDGNETSVAGAASLRCVAPTISDRFLRKLRENSFRPNVTRHSSSPYRGALAK
jgi:hypothetical protein